MNSDLDALNALNELFEAASASRQPPAYIQDVAEILQWQKLMNQLMHVSLQAMMRLQRGESVSEAQRQELYQELVDLRDQGHDLFM